MMRMRAYLETEFHQQRGSLMWEQRHAVEAQNIVEDTADQQEIKVRIGKVGPRSRTF
jgi:hypothetical protein